VTASLNSPVQISVSSDTPPRRFHAMVPVLLGLLVPALVLFVVDRRALGSASVLLHIYLIAIFVIATLAYIVSVFDQGEVTNAIFDKATRLVTIERTGLLAVKNEEIPFSEIASVRLETRYDDDGYKSAVPLIVLATREVVPLPSGSTEADVAAMREILGRG